MKRVWIVVERHGPEAEVIDSIYVEHFDAIVRAHALSKEKDIITIVHEFLVK